MQRYRAVVAMFHWQAFDIPALLPEEVFGIVADHMHTFKVFVVSARLNDQNTEVAIFCESSGNNTTCGATASDDIVLDVFCQLFTCQNLAGHRMLYPWAI